MLDRRRHLRGALRRVPTYLSVALVLSACSEASTTAPELGEGVLAEFVVSGETFRVFVTDPDAISAVLALDAGTSQASIPNGRLLEGPGAGDHNLPWSWHLDPEDIEMAESTIELCDGRPSLVEQGLEDWIADVGRFCPWGAELVSVEDFR